MKRSSLQEESIKSTLDSLRPHEPDLAYWLEHVLHWHALLLAVIAFLVAASRF